MRVRVSEQTLKVQFSRWEKVLGLMGDIDLPRASVGEIEVVDDPVAQVMRSGLKIGLRLPWLSYVGRSIKLDEVWAVRRHIPALAFSVRGCPPLRRVTLSTRDARALAAQLRG